MGQVFKTTKDNIELKVAEARAQRDVGRSLARISRDVMTRLGLRPGDFVSIEGKRSTVAQAWPAYDEDEGLDIVRMDGILRYNTGTSTGDTVTVSEAEVKPASKIALAPTEAIKFSSDFGDYVLQILEDKPVSKGDVILIPVLGEALKLIVVSIQPSSPGYISEDTAITVKEEPVKETEVSVPQVTYEDIGGLDDAKEKIREMIELPIKHPELFEQMGITPHKGILLYGPPGTGKTLLAKAVATESSANFISVKGPEVLSKWVGESEKAIREIFKKARQAAPCIVFFDEVDSIAPHRGEHYDSGVTERMVNQLLSEMDGLVSLKNVVVIAATNRPDMLDLALLRPGRFDRNVYIPLPDKRAREEILKVHTRKMPVAEDVHFPVLAEKTEGYTGADIEAICREAALNALREDMKPKKVQMKHFEAATKAIPMSLSSQDLKRYEDMKKNIGSMFI